MLTWLSYIFHSCTSAVWTLYAECERPDVVVSVIDVYFLFMFQGCVDSEGLTVSVQVVSLPWQDEQCLQVMKDLETGVKLNQ